MRRLEPAVLGGRLASGLIRPLVRRLFVPDGPGAGLVDRPVRLTDLVSFRGEKRTLGEKEVHRLAGRLVAEAVASPGERPFPPDEEIAVTDALARRLLALGDLDMDDAQAVRLGSHELARRLHHRAPPPDGLTADACVFLDSATQWACLHILEFFTRRSTFVARTLVQQTRTQAQLITQVNELLARVPRPDARDAAFERRYLAHLAQKHGTLTIYGIDLADSPRRWPLDAAYLSLEATGHGGDRDPLLFGMEPSARASRPADRALADHERVLLRGVAGSGKTTLIQWLAVSAATGATETMAHLTGKVPFVLPLRTLTRHGERLPAPASFLSATGSPLAGAQPEGWEDRVLAAGRGLVLVDGLDEVPEAERERARSWLTDLVTAYPGNGWLVTSRPSAVRDDWLAADGFTELTLTAMSTADVTSFVRRWHRAAATGNPQEDARLASYGTQLLQALRTKPDLGRLATNPLMCGLICALHRDRRGYLPHGRKELYEAALSMLLVRRDRERDMAGPELSEEPQLQLLQRLAYWLIRNGRTEMDRSRAERIVAEILPAVPAAALLGDAAAVLDHFLIRTGLLLAPTADTLHFVHRTFQDFLGARAAVEAGDLGLLAEHADDDQWSDVIRMAVAQARPRERAELLDLLTSRPGKRARLLAMACLEHATELDPAVRRRVEDLASSLLPPRTSEEARELAEVGPLVLELLPGPDGLSDEEAEAVTATAALAGSDAAVAVLARYAEHPADRVRISLMLAWSRFDAELYADEVLSRVGSDDFFVRASSPEALRALRLLGRRTRVSVEGDHALRDVLRALPDGVEELGLTNNSLLDDLRPLRDLGSLHQLTLGNCPAVRDLAPLAELEPESLVLGDLGEVSGLDRLPSLRRLALATSLPDGLAALPRSAPLTRLHLGATARATGLSGLSHWRTLTDVNLTGDLPLAVEDWRELAALPALARLSVDARIAASALGAPELPQPEELYVFDLKEGMDLSPLGRMCPGLRTVRLIPAPFSAPVDAARYARDFTGAEITVFHSRPYALS